MTIGKNGSVEGDIQAAVVSVFGSVNGSIAVEERCELRGNAHLIGDLDAPRLVIEEGATFVGRSRVLPKGSPVELPADQNLKTIEGSGEVNSEPTTTEAPKETSD